MQGCGKLCEMIDYLMKEKSITLDRSKGKIKPINNNKSFSISNFRPPTSQIAFFNNPTKTNNKINKSTILPVIEEEFKTHKIEVFDEI